MIYIIIAIVLLALYVISTYNGLIKLRNRKDDQFSQIDVQLKRRADLIPNIIETVKGYAKHETETLENVIKARNTFLEAKDNKDKLTKDDPKYNELLQKEIEATRKMDTAISNLMITVERYPELKANEGFLKLQTELSTTEDKISYARQFYNDTVLKYNNKVQMFPSNIIANMFNFKEALYFEIDEKDKEVPKVSF